MSWLAVQKIEEAAETTRDLLLPPHPGLWVKLTLLTFLTGSGLGTVFSQLSFLPYHGISNSLFPTAFQSASLVSLVVALSLIILFVGSLAEFTLFRSIIEGKSLLGRYFRENSVNAVRYMTYRLFISLTILFVLLAIAGLFLHMPFAGIIALLLFTPLLMVVILADMLIRDFVLIEMIENESKLITAVKDLWRGFSSQWREIGVYLAVRGVLSVAIAVTITTLAGFVTMLFAVPGVMLLFLTEFSVVFLLPLIGITVFTAISLVVVAMPFHLYVYSFKLGMYRSLKENTD